MNASEASTITVAVTGVGAIIGQGIVRSLRMCKPRVRIVGIDRSDRSVGPSMCDTFVRKPACAEHEHSYLQFWLELVRAHGVQLVLPGLEVDVEFLDRERAAFMSSGAVLALNRPKVIALANDKWALAQALAFAGLPRIPTIADTTWDEAVAKLGSPPLLLKPRRGNGSRDIVRLLHATDYDYWSARANGPTLLQRVIGSDDEEFTVGSFGLGDGSAIAPIIFRRRLSPAGNTIEAEVVDDARVSTATEKLVRLLQPLGPTNFQFRIHEGHACLFDLNARFSSSNSLRTAFGYNESQMAIDLYAMGRAPQVPSISHGTAWRYSEDYVIHARHPV